MQDPRMPPTTVEILQPKSRKKKASNSKGASSLLQLRENGVQPKPSKRSNHALPLFQQQQQQSERSNSDSLPDSSTPGNEYRALRRNYLLLEEESFALGAELREIEDEVKTLEGEKVALLDQLVVLEGLVDPSELQPSKM